MTITTQIESRSLRRRGALVLAPFGLLWSLVAASGLPAGAALAVRLLGLLAAGALVVLALRSGDRVERERRQPEGWHRQVGVVNLGELTAIVVVVAAGLAVDRPELVPPLVCLVVGVHFVPLARLFDQPEYRATAAGLLAGAAAGLVALAASPETSRALVGTVAALTLWATSAVLSLRR